MEAGTGQMYQDEYGRAVLRTPETHPTDYDGFVLWYRPRPAFRESINEIKLQVSNIQLRGIDYNRFCKLSIMHFGEDCGWDTVDPYVIEGFLREWYANEALVLMRIMQFCDPLTEIHFWRTDCHCQ